MEIQKGEVVAIIGASGSGKSLLAHCILGILPENAMVAGEIIYKDKVLNNKEKALLRGKEIALIPQSVTYLDPLMRIDKQILGNRKDKRLLARQEELFDKLDLDKNVAKMFAHQLSGGMARRVLFVMALIDNPQLLIADEPTAGMHETQAITALNMLKDCSKEGKGVLLIIHDIELALKVADKIVVFYAGMTIEISNTSDFIKGEKHLRHPYTRALYRALPQNEFFANKQSQPKLNERKDKCVYYNNCDIRSNKCKNAMPEMRALRDGFVRCFNAT